MKTNKPRVPVHKHGPQAQRSHEIRIIGGLWKRTKLKVAGNPACAPRPTGCAKPCSIGWART